MLRSDRWRLYASPGSGSAIVEALLVLANAQFEIVDVSGFECAGRARDILLAANPLAQVPAVRIGVRREIVTESAAITLLIAETFPEAGLAPQQHHHLRPRFLRRLSWLAATLYATFPYTDFPNRWVQAEADILARQVLEYRCELWKQFAADLSDGPWVLGDAFSALDVFICVMTRWRPRRDWFATQTPHLHAIAEAVEAHPKLRPVWTRNRF